MYIIEDSRILYYLIILGILWLAWKIIKGIIRTIKWFFHALFSMFTGGRTEKKHKASDDWLYKAQMRQEVRFENAMPPRTATATQPRKKTRKEKRNEKRGLSPTGWEYDEETGEWLPPASLNKEARDRWEWDENKRIWVDKYKKR